MIQNVKRTETDPEDDDDQDDDEEEIPEEAGTVYDTFERDVRYEPIRTEPENDCLQLHTDGEMPQGENSKLNIRRTNRNVNRPNRYGSVAFQGNVCMWLKIVVTGAIWSRAKGTPQPMSELVKKPQHFLPAT